MGQVQIKQVQEVVAAERAYALALLERAVRIQSGTHNHEGVRQVQALFAEELVKLGFTVTDIEHAHYADSLLATRSGKGLRILLVGHSDTVFETGSDTAFRLDTQKCHGQGTQDMKGGMVVMLSTLRALVKTDMLPDCRYTVFLNSHEEVGSVESANTLERLARGHDVALVLESAGKKGEYVCGRKGVLEYELQVRGVAGHAGNTVANRRSAVEELAYKIINLREWVANQEGMLFNAGVIQGGTRSNIIAEEACAELDIRYVTPQQRMAFEKRLRAISQTSVIPGTRTKLVINSAFPPMTANAANRLVQELAEESASLLGHRIKGEERGGGSDASLLSAAGCAVIDGLGPRGGGEHSDREFVYLKSITEQTELLAVLLCMISENSDRFSNKSKKLRIKRLEQQR